MKQIRQSGISAITSALVLITLIFLSAGFLRLLGRLFSLSLGKIEPASIDPSCQALEAMPKKLSGVSSFPL